MPRSQARMDGCATSNAFGATHGFQRRTGMSSAIPAFARDNSTQADQFRRRGGTTFSHRLRRSLPKRGTLWATQAFPVARHCPAHTARTGSCATGLRRAKQQGDCSKRLLEFADSEKAPALSLSQTGSPQPQPAGSPHGLRHCKLRPVSRRQLPFSRAQNESVTHPNEK